MREDEEEWREGDEERCRWSDWQGRQVDGVKY